MRVVQLLLRDEPTEQRNARHRCSRQAGGSSRRRHRAPQARQHRDIPSAGLVFDGTSHEEQRALVAGVCEQVCETSRDGRAASRSRTAASGCRAH